MKTPFIALLLPALGIAGVCSNTSFGNGVTCVQSNKCTSGAGAVASLNCSFSSLPTIGHFVVVGAGSAASAFSAASDNQGNTYHTDATLGSGSTSIQISSAVVATSSGTFTITVTPGSSATTTVHIYEFSGMAASSVNDASGTAAATNATATVTTSGTPVQAIELLFATVRFGSGTTSAGAGYTILENDSGGSGSLIADEGQTVTNANSGTQTATFTLGSSQANVSGIVTYKAAATGAVPSVPKSKKLLKFGL